ncbi:Growth-regulating factor 12 [Sesamum alatum]|uniref:Growth-regulating factor n=1 Tax=Sesamum alatum TaxID=300844 RepID=A0AAE1Y2Z3_9LAMI|nr:Growth-regulating factor 12 [Sesamum alatum]
MEAQSPPSKIARFVGNGAAAARVKCGFTLMQLRELEQQLLIYHYMEAGITVPTSLILPILRSFDRFPAAHLLYPNLLRNNPLCCDPKCSMDPEPRRCRRTDGKKWRCSKNAVEGQKYCHSHLHRGRPRSRDHVQPSPTTTTTTTCSSDKFSPTDLSIFI